MSPALESNAGDRYHFVFAARRALDLLHPITELRRLVMEGVAPEDATGDDETFLGVDLTEYYGGDRLANAHTVAIRQVKYSPTHPAKAWTLARLIAPRHAQKPESSVVGKLARAFEALYTHAPAVAYRIGIVTNQPLSDDDAAAYGRVRTAIENGTEADLEETDLAWLKKFKTATRLDNAIFQRFVGAFDIGSFASPLLTAAEGLLAREIATFTSDIHVGDLIAYIQEHALPNRPTDIFVEDVLTHLRLFAEDFAPAPSQLQLPPSLFRTKDAHAVAGLVRGVQRGIVLAHGLAGRGKTSTVQVLAREYADEFRVVIYDCFGSGSGMKPGHERFPYSVFFTQVINDLDGALHTGILATTKVEYTQLARRFEEALRAAGEIATQSGQRLLLAVDAIDNAAAAAADSTIRGRDSFVPLLGKVDIPEGVVILTTARSENLGQITVTPAASVELEGFTADETLLHARSYVADLTQDEAELLHDATDGTGRVQALILRDVAADPTLVRETYIRDEARKSAFEYYREHAPNRLDDPADRAALAILVEAIQPITFATWSALSGCPEPDLRRLQASLAFGLRDSDSQVEWRDQEFWDFVREFLAQELPHARATLAAFCASHVTDDPYARRNYSAHLYKAGRLDELVDHWLTDNRIEEEVCVRSSQDETIRSDLAHAVLAATARQRRGDVLQLLTIAADVTQGRNLFFHALAKVPTVAIEEGFADAVIGWLQDSDQGTSVARMYLAFAAALGAPEQAWDLRERGMAILRHEARRGHGDGFHPPDILNIAVADARFKSLDYAIEQLGGWSPAPVIAPVYADLITGHLALQSAGALLAVLPTIKDEVCRAFAALGLLARRDLLPSSADLPQLVAWTGKASLAQRVLHEGPHVVFLDATEALLHGSHLDLARSVLPLAEQAVPRFRHEPVDRFIRYMALREHLTGEVFEPAKAGTSRSAGYDADLEHVRSVLARTYPAAVLRVRAAAGVAGAADIEEHLPAIKNAYANKTYRREPTRLDVKVAAQEVLHALRYGATRSAGAVADVREMVERELSNPAHREYGRLATILAGDDRYHRDAEELFLKMLDAERPPQIRATEAVDVLLESYAAARSVERTLGTRVVDAARSLADAIDATIDARTVAVLGSFETLVDRGATPSSIQVQQLAALVEYGADMDSDAPVRRMEDTLTAIAQVTPMLAVELALDWERAAKLHVLLGLPPVAIGIAKRSDTNAGVVATVASFAQSPTATAAFFEAIEPFVREADRATYVSRWAEYVRRMPGSERFQHAEIVNAYASVHGLADEPSVATLSNDLTKARAEGIKYRERADAITSTRLKSDEEIETVEVLLADSSLRALARLEEVPSALGAGQRADAVVASLAASLSTANTRRLLGILERWVEDASYRIIEAVPMIHAVVERCPNAAADARAVAARLLTRPGILAMLLHDYDGRSRHALRSAFQGAEDALFDPIAEAIAKSLDSIGTDTVYRWIGELVRSRDATTASTYYNFAAPRAFQRVPSPRPALSENAGDGATAIVAAIGEMLAHPRVEFRFRAVYAAIEALLANTALLPNFLAILKDEAHSRWMTRREWMLFTFHYLALRHTDLLQTSLDVFVDIARNRAFPHAKHRSHAREIVLAVAAAYPDAVADDVRTAVLTSQQPIRFTKEKTSRAIGSRHNEDWYNQPFHFDPVDTIPYWYDPLGSVFNLTGADIANRAMPWIVEKWGLTHDRCLKEDDADRHEYDWRETSHDHGSEPTVETLQSYAERHAMFVVAGELVDSMPVVRRNRDVMDEWTDWIRSDARGADPSLPSGLLGPPPSERQNYGLFDAPLREWRASRPESDYLRHIATDDAYVLVAEMEGGSREYDFDVSVRTILVPRSTAQAFAQAATASSNRFYAQSQSLDYTTILPELEADMRLYGEAYDKDEEDEEGGEDDFALRLTLGELHQEFDFHRRDPRWKSFSRNYPYPSSVVQEALALRRLTPLGLTWVDDQGVPLVEAELWHDGKADEDVDGASGYRLLLTKTALARLMNATSSDVAFIVTLRRQTAYKYRNKDEKDERDEYDRGSTRVFLASSLLSEK
ncbi:MAG: hypothetical protein DMF56_20440 [Acidobacteria bacterium]|nr:MAG: hypothetical protein DMF56_20440 [Acidobacteriota bacterium]